MKAILKKYINGLPDDSALLRIILFFYKKAYNIYFCFVRRTRRLSDYIDTVRGIKPVLDYLEVQIADHCNLKCKGCGHFSNIVDGEVFFDIKQYEKDFQRLSELFRNIRKIRIMGGEPLLNDRFTECVEITRKAFPDAEVHVATNGLTLMNISAEAIEILRKNDVEIHVSLYKPLLQNLTRIEDFLKTHSLKYDITRTKKFVKAFNPEGTSNPKTMVKSCLAKDCTFLSPGYISRCSMPYCIRYFNQRFKYSIATNDMINIYDTGITGAKLKAMFRKPLDICGYCAIPQWVEWERGTGTSAKITDWSAVSLISSEGA